MMGGWDGMGGGGGGRGTDGWGGVGGLQGHLNGTLPIALSAYANHRLSVSGRAGSGGPLS